MRNELKYVTFIIIYHWYSAGETEAGSPGFILIAVNLCVCVCDLISNVDDVCRGTHNNSNKKQIHRRIPQVAKFTGT